MKSISVQSSRGRYHVVVGSGLLSRCGSLLGKIFPKGNILIVTQKGIAQHYEALVRRSLGNRYQVHTHLVPEGEQAKSASELGRIYQAALRSGLERGDLMLALGGGVVGDLTGFAAATYLRGIRFANVATTLLAQVDSAVGGKTGINLKEGKNLVGAFYPPSLVISDVATLRTLPERELCASLAEVVKYGMIRSGALFRYLEQNGGRILRKERASLARIVWESARLKARVVEADELETKGERMILNFGHTFGHALEQATGYRRLLHGEAVSIGMVCAARLAVRLGIFSETSLVRLVRLLRCFRLPVAMPRSLGIPGILEAMKRDKKKSSGRLRFVLPTQIGSVVIREDVSSLLVKKVLSEVTKD